MSCTRAEWMVTLMRASGCACDDCIRSMSWLTVGLGLGRDVARTFAQRFWARAGLGKSGRRWRY